MTDLSLKGIIYIDFCYLCVDIKKVVYMEKAFPKILNLVCATVWGGGEQYVYDLCLELQQQGIENLVVTDKKAEMVGRRLSEVATVVEVSLNQVNGVLAIRQLVSLIRQEKIDVIQCHSGKMMPLCIILKKLTGVAVVSFRHNALPAKTDWYHQYLRKTIDAFVCVSSLVLKLQTEKLSDVEKRRFYLVYNGISTERFNKRGTTKGGAGTTTAKQDVFVVGYAGRLSANKGLDILVKSLGRLKENFPEAVLYLAGADEKGYRATLEQLIRDRGLSDSVVFKGLVSDMATYYRELDAFVLPSQVREAFGLVLCEAMYCGVPVITSDSGAQREIISDESMGYVLSPFTVESLTETLRRLAIDDALRKTISENGHKRIEKLFTMKQTIRGLQRVYQALLH